MVLQPDSQWLQYHSHPFSLGSVVWEVFPAIVVSSPEIGQSLAAPAFYMPEGGLTLFSSPLSCPISGLALAGLMAAVFNKTEPLISGE